jgi:putative endonuclease
MEVWHLYLVRAADGSLYTGIATDVERRLAEHGGAGGRGSKYLRGRGPVELAFDRPIGSHGLALKVEHRVKRLSRPDKERLIESRPAARELLEALGVDPDGEAAPRPEQP